MSEQKLIPGAFYWVQPVYDVDLVPLGFEGREWSEDMAQAISDHWTQKEQPARFEGYDENGNERWLYIGRDEPDNWWPARWVGAEIIRSFR